MSTKFKSIVVLTGAGVSAESGIKTFRDSGGLWENHRLEDVCTPEGFTKNPALVHQFYNARRAQLAQVTANAAHTALAEFERRFSGEFTLVTQNVDDLHERAGSRNVLHMHGELLMVRCIGCGKSLNWQADTHPDSVCPNCKTSGQLRPDIVWFGEIPKHMAEIEQALSQCDLIVAIGTSGSVYPAAGFVALAQSFGAHTMELNLQASAGQSLFDEYHLGPASQTVLDYFAQLVC